ncbi:hypothetical protein MKX03_019895 [Papaver bracteatum]|nr:hypothetical protein MKX03_019895 [Papaver bracteatum]
MYGYYNSIIKGVSNIMVLYSSWNDEKMHANHDLVTNFLKVTINFRVETLFELDQNELCVWDSSFPIDWQFIYRVTSPAGINYTYSVQDEINTGIDMIMIPMNHSDFINDLTYLVEKNVIPMRRIDDVVQRIIKVKFTMGLFENPMSDHRFVDYLGSQIS